MDAPTIRAYLSGLLTETTRSFVKDVEALSEAQLHASPGGVARSPMAFIAECAGFSRRVAAHLRGEDAPVTSDASGDAAIAAMTKESAVAAIRGSSAELLAAWRELPEADMARTVPLWGEEMPIPVLIGLVSQHLAYHDGQLNMIQAMGGDGTIHW